jgi:antitoxin MazE
MQIAKWGNSLAVRLPSTVVKALGLKEGDQVEVTVRGDRHLEIARDDGREKALEGLRSLRVKLPPGWKFDREDVYEERLEQLTKRFNK